MKTTELRKMIEANIEDEATPARVAEWCKANEGKQVRVNNLPPGFVLRRQYGMTHMESPDYHTSGGHKGCSYQLAYVEKGATFPKYTNGSTGGLETYPAEGRGLRELNPCYYRGLEERNAQRRALLSDGEACRKMAEAITAVQRAVAAYRGAVAELAALTEYGTMGAADQYAIEAAAGILDEKRK